MRWSHLMLLLSLIAKDKEQNGTIGCVHFWEEYLFGWLSYSNCAHPTLPVWSQMKMCVALRILRRKPFDLRVDHGWKVEEMKQKMFLGRFRWQEIRNFLSFNGQIDTCAMVVSVQLGFGNKPRGSYFPVRFYCYFLMIKSNL